jgi:hypothetical protein
MRMVADFVSVLPSAQAWVADLVRVKPLCVVQESM